MTRKLILAAAAFGATAILLGAFGAHALKERLAESALNAFETGVRYQMYHVFLLLFMVVAPLSERGKNVVFWLTVSGVSLFSGSLYLLAAQELFGVSLSFLGPLTPVGGFLLIGAWSVLFLDFLRKK